MAKKIKAIKNIEFINKYLNLIAEIINESKSEVAFFIKFIFPYVIKLIKFILPFLTYYAGISGCYKTNVFVSLIIVDIFIYFCDGIKKRMTSFGIPIPVKRFTDVNEDGEIDVEYGRLQEMMVYVAELEDYFEKKGKL